MVSVCAAAKLAHASNNTKVTNACRNGWKGTTLERVIYKLLERDGRGERNRY
jgi:hypothetical protein